MIHMLISIIIIALAIATGWNAETASALRYERANSLSKQDIEVLPAPVSESSHTSTPTATATPAPEQTSGRVYLDKVIPPCTLITVQDRDPCVDAGDGRSFRAYPGFPVSEPSLQHQHYLDDYDNDPYVDDLSPAYYLNSYKWTTHIALRGVGLPNTARCTTRLARGHRYVTRSEASPEWSVSRKNTYTMECYVDFKVQEYIVGKGAPTLTVSVLIFGADSTQDSQHLRDLQTRFLPQIQDIYEGYEWVLYLLPSGTVTVEVFEAINGWGVGKDQNRPTTFCNGAEICAYSSLPYEAIPLSELQNDTKVRHARLLEKNHGRVRPEPIYADIILDTYELTSFFTQVGAYDHPVATPAAPPIPGENDPYTPGTNVDDPPSGDDATVTVPGGLDDTATDTPTPIPTATTPPAPLPTDTPTPMPTTTSIPAPSPTDTPTLMPTATSTPAPLPTDTPTPMPTAVSIATADRQSYSCFYPYAGSCKRCYSVPNCNYQQ